MLSLEEAQDRAEMLVAAARKAGADAADAAYGCDASSSVSVRLGALEDVERSESEHVSLRVFVGRRSASVSSSDMAEATLAGLVDRVIAMAAEAPEDNWSGLAPEDRLMRGRPANLDTVDESDPEPTVLRERALAAEDAARGVLGITNSEGGGAGHGRAQIALATSHGFAGAYAGTSHSTWVSVLAGTGEGMQRDYASHSARHLENLDDPDAIGIRAGHRAVARLNPRRVESGAMPIIFDPRVGNSLVSHLIGAIVGPSITRRSSFLLDSLGQLVFPETITILDDPRRERGLRSKPFDGEGLPTAERALIEQGVLTGWLLDSASARQLDMEPTGHALRGGGSPGAGATNVHMLPGSINTHDLMSDIKCGIYVTELIGHGINGVTGDYSRGAAGFLINEGTTECAVSEITIAGNLKDMFANIVAASDLDFRYAINVPTLRVDGMTVAGRDVTLEALAAATREAARRAMAYWGEEGVGLDHWEKAPGDPVSNADLIVDEHLKQTLGALAQDAAWLSEETADNPVRIGSDRLWLVDPIDGTRDFVRGRPGWAVSVALAEHGEIILAALVAPARGEIWLAAKGQGATRNGVALRASNRTQLAGARVPADSLPKIDRDLVTVRKPNSIALRMAMVAADEADLVATVRWGAEWDVAAASLIAREAGATVTDALGSHMTFNRERPVALGMLCCAPAIHGDAVARLRERALGILNAE